MLCFALSGVAALLYQTAWTRQFALIFGTSEPAVATVLAAYMGGLAVGAWLIERWLPHIERPVLVYAALELGIGVSAAVFVPAMVVASNQVLRSLFGDQPAPPGSEQIGTLLFYTGSTFVTLAVPTVLMGATLPLLARQAVQAEPQIGRRVGLFYVVNTLGAVGGALAGTFWLLPGLGLSRTAWVAAAVNLCVFLLAICIAPRTNRSRARLTALWSTASRISIAWPPSVFWILPLMLLCGSISFFHEVLWTRMLSHVLGSSLYAFGVMVASFLAGIVLGGSAGSLLARDRRWASAAFALAQIGCAVAGAAAYILLDRLLPSTAGLRRNVFFAATVLMPLTFFIGMTYPLAVRILAARAEAAAAASARVYAWNTVGAIAGALAGGLILIPSLRFEGAIQLAVVTSALLAAASIWMLGNSQRAFGIVVTVGALAIALVFQPAIPTKLLRASPLSISNDGRILYYRVGRSASVVMLEQDGALALRTNGLPEAMMEMRGSAPRLSGENWLTPLAVIARPRTHSMLVVGYGGGVIIEGVPPEVSHIDVIEIEPRVIDANRATRALRKQDPVDDPRVNIIINDARGALNLTSRRYDAIVSQPSHPWTAAASHLYTREFMQQARGHLSDGGVFVQWMNISFIDEPLLRSLAATLIDVFSATRVYRPDPSTLVFLASNRPLDLERSVAATGLPLSAAPTLYGRFGINTVEDLVTALALDGAGALALARGAPLITDDRNRMAMASVYENGHGLTPEAVGRFFARYDPLRKPDSWIFRDYRGSLAFDYIARRLAAMSAVDASVRDRLTALTSALGPTEAGYAVRAIAVATAGDLDAAQDLVAEGLQHFPESDVLRYEFVKPWLTRLARGTATRQVTAEAKKLTGSATAVVQATALAVARKWEDLSGLDEALAAALWPDPWKLEAVALRVEWRLRASATDERRRRYGDEALAIIDEAIVVQPALELYGLRVQSALAADRGDALVESIWAYGHGTFTNVLRLPQAQRAQARQTLRSLLQLLSTQTGRGLTEPARIDEVRTKLQSDAQRLGGT
jgi:spermidine synthase